jgi:hypothetical protein
LDEVDESETGSANLWSGPRKGAGRFSGPCLEERLVSTRGLRQPLDVEPEDIRLLFEVLFDIRSGAHRALSLLEEEDDEGEENG